MSRIIWTYRCWKAACRDFVGTSNTHFPGGDPHQLNCVIIKVNIYPTMRGHQHPWNSRCAGTSRWLKAVVLREALFRFCCRQTQTSNSTQLIKVCVASVSGEESGVLHCWCLTFSFASLRISELARVEECVSVFPPLTRRDDSVQELRHV